MAVTNFNPGSATPGRIGLAPESPDWGTAIKDASRLLRSFIHPALPPTIALMSFVLGLNLLADSLREQSMKD